MLGFGTPTATGKSGAVMNSTRFTVTPSSKYSMALTEGQRIPWLWPQNRHSVIVVLNSRPPMIFQ